MNTIFRNFLSVLRRFRMASFLNILGLGVAFAAFLIIMIQVQYDLTYNDCHPNKDRIFRLEASLFGSPYQAVTCRPVSEVLANNEAHTEAMSLTMPWGGEASVRLKDANNQDQHFLEKSVMVQPSFTRIFGFEFTDGKANALEDPQQILLPESLAEHYFGTVFAVGKSIEINEKPFVVGAVYKDFPKNSTVENTLYMALDKDVNAHEWGNWSYHAYFLLDNAQSAEHYLDHVVDYVDYEAYGYPSKEDFIKQFGSTSFFRLTPLKDIYFNNDVIFDTPNHASRQTLALLISIAVLILLIAAINYTNFSTALTPMRMRSINTQKVLGSSNAALRVSLLAEAVLMAFLSFGVGVLIVEVCQGSFIAQLITPSLQLSQNLGLLIKCGVMSILIGLAAGLYPALYMTSFSPALVLKGSFGLSPKGRSMRSVLLCIQFVASLALIVVSMFMFLQNRFMTNGSLGYDRDRIIVTQLSKTVMKSKESFTSKVKAYSGIEAVAFCDRIISVQDDYSTRQESVHDLSLTYTILTVTPDFLKVIGVAPIEGRDFLADDALHTYDGVCVMNQVSRDLYNVAVGDSIGGNYVAGIIPDIKFATFKRNVEPLAFCIFGSETWFAQYASNVNVAYIRLAPGIDPQDAIAYIQNVYKELDPTYPFSVDTLNSLIDSAYNNESNLASLVTVFGLLAVLLSVVGVFGLVVFESEHKRKEIGVRKVFGSTALQILEQSSQKYIKLLLLCSLIALPLSFFVVRKWLDTFAFRISIQAWVFIAAFVAVAFITLCTVFFQSWRAANENPVRSLRSE